ncbi:hypothetical protein ACS3QZ_09815 [Shimia sp. W99]
MLIQDEKMLFHVSAFDSAGRLRFSHDRRADEAARELALVRRVARRSAVRTVLRRVIALMRNDSAQESAQPKPIV